MRNVSVRLDPLIRRQQRALRCLKGSFALLKVDWIAVALVAVGMGLRFWLLVRGWPALDSDEGIVGLMGRHILYRGERPIFFYGQHYMGALEAYAAAATFRFLGATPFALRLAIFPLTLGFLVTMYFLGRAAFGRVTGLITLTFLAVGPAYGLLRELAVVGGYQETLLCGALLLLLVYVRLCAPRPQAVTRKAQVVCYTHYLLMGFIIGIGIWSDELILTLVVASLGVLMVARPREIFGPAGLILLLGLLIGGFPFIAYNVGHGGLTFIELSHQQLSGSGTGFAAVVVRAKLMADQFQALLTTEIPAVLGSPHSCVVPGSLYAGYASFPEPGSGNRWRSGLRRSK